MALVRSLRGSYFFPIIFVLSNALPALALCNLDKAAEALSSDIRKRARLENREEDYFSRQQKDISLLFSIDSKKSNELLGNLSNVYLGESVNEIVAEAITSKQKAMIPVLESAVKDAPDCSKDEKKCVSQAKMLLDFVKKGQKFKTDEDAIKKYSKSDVCRELKSRL